MINRDLKRIQDDLATVKSALGWDLPFNRQNVVLSLAIGSGGLLCVAWMVQPYRLASPWHYLSALGFMCLPPLLYLLYTGAKGLEVQLGSRRRWDFQRAGLSSLSLVYAFFFWAIATDRVSADFGVSSMVFIFGAILLAIAAGDRSYISNIGWAIGFMLLAVLGLVSDGHFLVLFGMQFAIGGFVSAAVMAWQLRAVQRLQRAH